MTNNNKETEQAELHKTIWRIANDLRVSVDGWDFKTYVLGMLFYRFISENLTSYWTSLRRSSSGILGWLETMAEATSQTVLFGNNRLVEGDPL